LSCGLEPLPIHVVHDSLTEMSPKEFVYIIQSQIVTSKADVLDLLIKPKLGFSDVYSQCDHGDCLDLKREVRLLSFLNATTAVAAPELVGIEWCNGA
jgi:hypothetical protein